MRTLVAPLLIALALTACGKRAEQANAPLPKARQAASTANGEGGVTPMAQRVAVLVILN